jgi:hypothetical protein
VPNRCNRINPRRPPNREEARQQGDNTQEERHCDENDRIYRLHLIKQACQKRVTPKEAETVVSMLARAAMGEGILYYNIQAATAVILFLAVNTSFQDFPCYLPGEVLATIPN